MDAPQQFQIRVLLLDDVSAFKVHAESGFELIDRDNAASMARFEEFERPLKVDADKEGITIGEHSFAGSSFIIMPRRPYILTVNGKQYRGRLKVELAGATESLDVFNCVPLEPYLAGVVGAEMPGYWEPAALKAQAIAARTYCLYIKRKFGKGRNWDLKKTAAHQIYKGVAAETPQIWKAVNSTTGEVLVCEQKDGRKDIFPAYYCSTCGGHTENSENVFSDSFEPLKGVKCPYGHYVAKPSLFLWDIVELSKTELTNRLSDRYPTLSSLGRIDKLIIVGKSEYADFTRVTKIKLVGENKKQDYLRAEDFRLAVDASGRKLKSSAFKLRDLKDKFMFLNGRGYGHGVGMCQCGAQAMARRGKKAEEILMHYYPGAQLKKLY